MARQKLGEILVSAGIIDEAQLRAALGDQRNWGQPLGMTLVKMGLVDEQDLVRALAAQLQLPVVTLEGKRVQPEVLELVPAEFAEEHLCVPLFVREKGGIETLHLGMEDPCNVQVIDELSFRVGMSIQPVMVSPSELVEAIDRFYRRDAGAIELEEGRGGSRAQTAPNVQESLFREVREEVGELDTPEPRPKPATAAPAARDDEATHRTILRALCHLLIDKGVIQKDELQQLVASLHPQDR